MRPILKAFFWMDVGLVAVCGFAMLRSSWVSSPIGMKAGLSGIAFWTAMAFWMYRAIQESKREHEAYLKTIEEKSWEEARRIAKDTALPLPPGLVAGKVHLPNDGWLAFERKDFQFVIFRDKSGAVKTATI